MLKALKENFGKNSAAIGAGIAAMFGLDYIPYV